MISIDDSQLKQRALNIDGCHMADITRNVKSVKIDGAISRAVLYCDTNLGFAIKHKTDLSGMPILIDGDFVYEFVFGVIEVEFDDMAQ